MNKSEKAAENNRVIFSKPKYEVMNSLLCSVYTNTNTINGV